MKWYAILFLFLLAMGMTVSVDEMDKRIQILEERCTPPHVESDEKKEIGA